MTVCRIHGNPKRDYATEWKWWRKAHHMTQAQLASALGLTWRTILNIEKGYTRPSVTSRMKLQALQNKYQQESAWQQQSPPRSL